LFDILVACFSVALPRLDTCWYTRPYLVSSTNITSTAFRSAWITAYISIVDGSIGGLKRKQGQYDSDDSVDGETVAFHGWVAFHRLNSFNF